MTAMPEKFSCAKSERSENACLAFLPAPGHGGAHDGADDEHDEGRDQSQQGEP